MEEGMKDNKMAGGSDVADNKGIAFLSYIGILFLVPLLAKKDSKFAQFHAKQGLVLFIAQIVTSLIGSIPIIGWIVFVVGWILWLILAIMGLVAVGKGEMKELPLIGGFAKKMNM